MGGLPGAYDPADDYLNYGATIRYGNSERMQLDEEGLPKIRYGKGFWYNPVTLSQYALAAYGRSLSGGDTAPLVRAADKLMLLQRSDGAFPYRFPYRHYTTVAPYARDWISGMAQGVALSALSRAYRATHDPKYLGAGTKALAFMDVSKENGGPRTNLADLHPSLAGYAFFLEYQTEPDVYTLNGFMFALLGLYDWWQTTDSAHARRLFEQGMRTLTHILPYYDLSHFSAYDLSYITHARPSYLIPAKPHIVPRYHAVHLTQLQALNSVAPDPVLSQFLQRWTSYVDDTTGQ